MDDNYLKFDSDLIIKNRRKLKLFAALNNLHLGVTYVEHWYNPYDRDYYWSENKRYAIVCQFNGFDIIDRRTGRSISDHSCYTNVQPNPIKTFKEFTIIYEKLLLN